MITSSEFDPRLTASDETREVTLEPGQVRWLETQTHSGENIGSGPTHVFFVELKGEAGTLTASPTLGPSD